MNALCNALTGNAHCLRVTSNCVAGVFLSGSRRIYNCRFMRVNGFVRTIGGNISTSRTLGSIANACNHAGPRRKIIGSVSPHGRWWKKRVVVERIGFRDRSHHVGRVLTTLGRGNVGSVRRTGRVYRTTNLSPCGAYRRARVVYFRGTG